RVFILIEKPAVLLRQTCSALVRDQETFANTSKVAGYLLLFIFIMGLLFAYSPLGKLLFITLFGAEEQLLQSILNTFRVVMFVSIFSAIRCLYQGIIISNMHTKWLTIGMIIRLTCMYGLSLYFIHIH